MKCLQCSEPIDFGGLCQICRKEMILEFDRMLNRMLSENRVTGGGRPVTLTYRQLKDELAKVKKEDLDKFIPMPTHLNDGTTITCDLQLEWAHESVCGEWKGGPFLVLNCWESDSEHHFRPDGYF